MSILAISGKKGHGKDVAGKIIQYLTSESNVYPFDLNIDYSHKSNWEVKKFADKLKDIICILINCTREQLEDESIKSKELGEEWWKIKSTMIHNDKFKTKDVIFYDYKYLSFLNNTITNLDKTQFISMNIEVIKTTPRLLLQLLGTECGREIIHPEIWVNSLMNEYKPLYGYQTTNSKITIGDISIPIPGLNIDKRVFPNWIITDMRFSNELEAVKKRGGITIRVNRPCDICGGSGYHKMSCPVSKSGEHYSENALDKSKLDYVVDNDSDIQSLIKKVKEILIKERLL